MPDRTPKPNTKPLKPYRRGETLGKQGLKLRKPAAHKGKTAALPTAPGFKPKPAAEAAEAEEEGEESEGETGEVEEEIEEEAGEESEEEEVERPAKRVSGKKGKKFLDNDAMLSLVASITGARETKNRQKVSKLKKKKTPAVPEATRKNNNAETKKAELNAAKAVVSAQARAKKDVKLGREPKTDRPKVGGGDGGERKRVSFA